MTLTRRDLLTTFLGAPLALAACKRNARVALPPGEIVGQSNAIGHRLRDGWRPMPRDGEWKDVGVAIVGGGIAGLAAAWRLRRRGIDDFLVFELEPRAGGTARSGESIASRIPWGAHYIPAPMSNNRTLLDLLGEMSLLEDGAVREEVLVRDPQERLFFRGTWYEGLYLHAGASADDVRQLAAFRAEVDRWIDWRDARGRRAFAIPVADGSDDADVVALDRITMREWMDERRLTSPRLRWYVDYACRDDYGAHLEDVSAWAGLFYFASRVPTANAESQPLLTWPEGNGHFVDHFLGAIGNRIRTSSVVTEVIPRDGGADVIVASHDNVIGYHARHVIVALPHFIGARLVRAMQPSPEFEYGAWMVANISLRDRPEEKTFPLSWDNVLYESPALGYVVATHQLDRDRGPTTFTYYYALCDRDPRVARERLLRTGRDEWADVALSDLSAAHPRIRDLATRVDVMRWGHAMIRPHVGFFSSAARSSAAKPVGAVHFANTDLSGVALFEEALYHGVRAADEVISLRG